MKFKGLIFIWLLCFSVILGFAQTNPPVIVVPTFDTVGGVTSDEAAVTTELFISNLAGSGKIRIADRNSFNLIVQQMQFQTTDWSDNNRVAQLGRALNAEYIIRGQIMKMGNTIFITASMIDVNTTSIIVSAREQMNSFDELFVKLPQFCQQILDRLPEPNWFVGRWRSTRDNMICIIELRADGIVIVERYDYKYINNGRESSGTARGQGTYYITEGIRFNRGTYSGQSWRLNITLTGITDTGASRNFTNNEHNISSLWKDSTKNAFEFGHYYSTNRTYSGVDWSVSDAWSRHSSTLRSGLPSTIYVSNNNYDARHFYYEFFRIQ